MSTKEQQCTVIDALLSIPVIALLLCAEVVKSKGEQ